MKRIDELFSSLLLEPCQLFSHLLQLPPWSSGFSMRLVPSVNPLKVLGSNLECDSFIKDGSHDRSLEKSKLLKMTMCLSALVKLKTC